MAKSIKSWNANDDVLKLLNEDEIAKLPKKFSARVDDLIKKGLLYEKTVRTIEAPEATDIKVKILA